MKSVSLISTRQRRAFTIPELMVALTIFSFVTVGIIFAHLYGLTMFRITETSLTATTAARQVAGKLTDEIRTCNNALIGNVKNGAFVALLNGEKQEGNGLAIYPTSNASNFVIYFVNSTDQTLRRTTDKSSSTVILAQSITNAIVFRAENHLGQVQTNKLNNRVIHFNLEFYHPRRFKQIADYFKLESSVTRRAE
jgi:prepilin-type N-terminal cleavage/methylation domain-containing protein